MKLLDLRRMAIRQQLQVRFRMRNGMDCLINPDGVAQVPSWKGIPDFNLEEELSAAGSFLLEPVTVPVGRKGAPAPRSVSRAELAEMVSGTAGAAAGPDHEEE